MLKNYRNKQMIKQLSCKAICSCKKVIKIKQNQKLKNKIFGLFQVLHPVYKRVYKLKLLTKWKIYNIFYISMLEQNITKKGQVNELLKIEPKLNTGYNKKYKIKAICKNKDYIK